MKISYIRTTSIIATFILVCLSIFQLLLILGMPIGYAAWGGKYKVLPLNLRIGSIISIIIYVIAIYTILSKSGIKYKHTNTKFVSIATWIFAILFYISASLNFTSVSAWERYLMGPLAIVLASSFLMVARYKATGSN